MWTTPKMDWKQTDRFNVSDYTRIKNNLLYLLELSSKIAILSNSTQGMYDKTVSDYLYAEDINAFEYNLELINQSVVNIDYGDTRTYYANDPMIDFQELNRIERVMSDLYDKLNNIYKGRKKLAFNLGMRGEF